MTRITVFGGPPIEAGLMRSAPEHDRPITVYGTYWCRDCHLAKAVLKLHNVSYAWVDIDEEPTAVETVLSLNGGRRIVPTIVFPDGRVLVEPSRRDLEAALGVAV